MHPLRRFPAALIAIVTALAASVLLVEPAVAAPAGSRNGAINFTVSSITQDARTTSIQQTITCTITVNNPHKSSHVRGTVNVASRVQCTANVAGIASALGLYLGSTLVSSNSSSNSGVAALEINTAASCVDGVYNALGLATIIFPAGFVPPTGDLGAWSNTASITC